MIKRRRTRYFLEREWTKTDGVVVSQSYEKINKQFYDGDP